MLLPYIYSMLFSCSVLIRLFSLLLGTLRRGQFGVVYLARSSSFGVLRGVWRVVWRGSFLGPPPPRRPPSSSAVRRYPDNIGPLSTSYTDSIITRFSTTTGELGRKGSGKLIAPTGEIIY